MSFIDEPPLHALKSDRDRIASDLANQKASGPKRDPSPTLQSDLPIRRRPGLGQSRTSPYPQSQDVQSVTGPTTTPSKMTRPRPGLNRTLSFCPSSSSTSETYASASRSGSPAPGRMSKPLERLASGEVMAPSMERSMSSLGIDGWTTGGFKSNPAKKEMDTEMIDEKMDGYPDEATIQARKRNETTLHVHVQMPIPMIIVDSPGKTSRPAEMSPGSSSPPPLTCTPGYERFSPSYTYDHTNVDTDADTDWTPGLYTPDTPGAITTTSTALAGYLAGRGNKASDEARD